MTQAEQQGPPLNTQIVLASFENRDRAVTAVQALRARGVPEDMISIAVRHDEVEVTPEEMAAIDQEAEETSTDVALGSAAGGLAGFAAGLALFSIPGLGQLLGVGVLVTTLGGAALGSAVGERFAHFTSLGVPEDRAEQYHQALGQGHVVVAVTARDAETVLVAREVLGEHNADEIDVHPYKEVDGSAPTVVDAPTTPGRSTP